MGDEKVSILVLLCRLVVFPENVFTVKRDKVSTLLMALLLSFKNSCFIIGSGVLDTQLSLTLCNSMDCSLSGSSVHGILQGRITGEGSHSLLQGIFPQPRDRTPVSHLSCTGWFVTTSTTWEARVKHTFLLLPAGLP